MASSGNARRLRRRLDAVTEATRRKVGWRKNWRDRAQALPVLSAALARAGIDAAEHSAVRYFADGARELARRGDSPELQRADAAFVAQDPRLTARPSLAAQAAERAPRFAGVASPTPPQPGGGAMTALDWYAWALAQAAGDAATRGPGS